LRESVWFILVSISERGFMMGKGRDGEFKVCFVVLFGIPLVIHVYGDDKKRASGHVLEYD